MTDIAGPLFQWLNANPELAGLATFTISAAESVAVIGTIVPGSITMTAIGTLAGAGVIPLWGTIFWAILGAIVGDGISYWLGHYFKDRIRTMWPFNDNPSVLQTGENFVHKYGVMSVFIGRFVGPVRALVPVVAGMLGMKPLQFTIANVTSAIGWAPAYMLPGIMLGAASLELPPDIALHVILAFFLGILFVIFCFWFVYKILQLIHFQIDQIQQWIWHQLQGSHVLKKTTLLLQHHDRERVHGQLNAAIYLSFMIIALAGLCLFIKWQGAANLIVNDAAYHLVRGIQNEIASNIMIGITLLGESTVIFPVILALIAYVLFIKRYRAALHLGLLTILTSGGIYVIKHLVQSPRPWGIMGQAPSFSMPSGHATVSMAFYVGIAYLLSYSLRPRARYFTFLTAFFIVLAVSISRIYLGAHWFTDILAGWLLGGAATLTVIISYQRYPEQPISPRGILSVIAIALTLSYAHYWHKHYGELQHNHTLQNWPVVTISDQTWWEKNNNIPSYRSSLFGFPSQRINLEWAGDLETIRKSLTQEGWSKPPVRDWISTLHRLADISSTQYLPLVSPQYLDKKPTLVLTRLLVTPDGDKQLMVIRLWNSNRVLSTSKATLWVGFVGIVPRSYSWILKKHPGEIEAESTLVFPKQVVANTWEWKILTLMLPKNKQRQFEHKILLVRSKH